MTEIIPRFYKAQSSLKNWPQTCHRGTLFRCLQPLEDTVFKSASQSTHRCPRRHLSYRHSKDLTQSDIQRGQRPGEFYREAFESAAGD